ncbi:hypothetical protein [Ammoniphilus sp. CFH 90114]|uniref:hypothetical protein n=1 Tax=Ammoniphilus sp. CFH 90114 TaxID=2493665 RepID=UPI00100E0BB8|nr:hypothetical protein [Ammoniphilus sp. CFH 90114]RXT07200.1 hypothetical protein EIZ39_13735 [Ammoniphilus sp. CFH 90114]
MMMKFLMFISMAVMMVGCSAETDISPGSIDLPVFTKMEVVSGKASYVLDNDLIEEARLYYETELPKEDWKKIGDTTGSNENVNWVIDRWEKGSETVLVRFVNHPDKDYIIFEDEKGNVLELTSP